MPTLAPDRASRVAVQEEVIRLLPPGVPSLAVAAAIGGWLDVTEMEPGAAEALARELARLRPLTD